MWRNRRKNNDVQNKGCKKSSGAAAGPARSGRSHLTFVFKAPGLARPGPARSPRCSGWRGPTLYASRAKAGHTARKSLACTALPGVAWRCHPADSALIDALIGPLRGANTAVIELLDDLFGTGRTLAVRGRSAVAVTIRWAGRGRNVRAHQREASEATRRIADEWRGESLRSRWPCQGETGLEILYCVEF